MSPLRTHAACAFTLVAIFGIADASAAQPETQVAARSDALVGGEPVPAGAWRSVGWLEAGCTAIMLDERALIYAAHCGVDHSRVLFTYEAIDPRIAIEMRNDDENAYPIRDCIVHPEHGVAARHDLALCFLDRPWSGTTSPIWSEQDKAAVKAGDEVLLLGYGRLQESDSTLRKSAAWAEVQRNDEELVIGDERRGTCPGDSGGPALARIGDGFLLMGILSEGQPATCGAGWYADLTENRDWIENHLIEPLPAGGCSASFASGDTASSRLFAIACGVVVGWLRAYRPRR